MVVGLAESGVNDGERLIGRARQVAVGLADTGLGQAEELLRRISPEGRAQAKRERAARARRRNRLMGQLLFAALASLLTLAALLQLTAPLLAIVMAAVVMTLLTTLIIAKTRPRTPGREALSESNLANLPHECSIWLTAQRPSLPPPALKVADFLARHLEELTSQLVGLDAREPAAAAVRTLIAAELPGLVESWRNVPPSLRALPQSNGRTPNQQLVEGLALIDAEITQVTAELARGALDEVATHGRYLELKYSGE